MPLTSLVPAPGPRRNWLRRAAPWLALLGLFVLIFARIPFSKVTAALAQVELISFAAWCVVFIFVHIPLDSTVQWFAFRRLHRPVSWLQVFYPRMGMTLANSLATVAGQAGMGYWLHRKLQVPLRQAASTTFFLLYLEIYSLLVIPTVLLLILPGYGPQLLLQSSLLGRISQLLALAWLAFAAALLFWKTSGPNFLQRLADRVGLWSSFHQASLGDYLLILLGKTAIQAVLNGIIVALLIPAHIRLSALDVFIYFPLVSVFGSLPITPGRLGTTQVGFLLLLGNKADPAQLVAFSLLWQVMINAVRWSIGIFFLPRLLRDLRVES
jgi:uncharacterized membrane protein YbhN (UPF0104 family)